MRQLLQLLFVLLLVTHSAYSWNLREGENLRTKFENLRQPPRVLWDKDSQEGHEHAISYFLGSESGISGEGPYMNF